MFDYVRFLELKLECSLVVLVIAREAGDTVTGEGSNSAVVKIYQPSDMMRIVLEISR